ncbi:hypothetical protein Adeg_0114 [Ammonifex degensii KC4]|uniref:ATPase n=1 Tax=Ammonifex degensii (strain DSM 10501 / KC4) TaxID=429009 RepID=C9RAL2_AMMDK|nr:hypothetical protein [Ammonifex degensii]ACX51289.1 hypothetical protein Adeg_0114 [Ammonifex degensii KC4]
MEFLDLLNELEELIAQSSRIPLTRKVIVDEDKVLDLLDKLRSILPEELRRAKWLVEEREKVLEDARKEAERIISAAQEEIARRAEESEIVRQAKERAEAVVGKAEEIAREIKIRAREYADEVLAQLEERLNRVLKEIQEGRSELRGMK